MTMHPVRVVTLAIAGFLAAGTAARADTIKVTLDTSPLSGTQTLIFGLTNFDASSNTVVTSDFAFGGGGAVTGSDDCTLGGLLSGLGCSGNLSSGVTLQDLDVAVVFMQQFEPGSTLSFLLAGTNNFSGPVPDQFAMFVCDVTLVCYSDDLSGAMLLLDLVGGAITPASFALFGFNGQELQLDPPVVTGVPEPAMLLLLGAGFVSVIRARAHGPKP